MKKIIPIVITVLVITALLGACSQDKLNPHAEALAGILMNAPNRDIYDGEYPVIKLGLGAPALTEAEKQALSELSEKLEAALEPHIAPNYLSVFMNTNRFFSWFPSASQISGETFELKSLKLKETTDDGQSVTATVAVSDGSELTFDVFFKLDDKGLVTDMTAPADILDGYIK